MRVLLIAALGILALAGCAAPPPPAPPKVAVAPPPPPPEPVVIPLPEELSTHYAAKQDGTRKLPAIDPSKFDPAMLRQRVAYKTDELPGTIIVDTTSRHLFFVEDGGTAIRYGIAIGREGFGWTGEGTIGRLARWPTWTPPPEMIRRDPKLARWKGGMPGSTKNPLGARALYILFDGVDSQYRIHGTNEPGSIGEAASSGCFRMLNHDVIDLFERVEVGARVVVI